MEEKLIENKKAADNYHEQFLEVMKIKKKKFKGRKSFGQKPKARTMQRSKPRIKYGKKQNELLEKLKQEKLSTALEKQKAGKKLNLFEARLILEQNKN